MIVNYVQSKPNPANQNGKYLKEIGSEIDVYHRKQKFFRSFDRRSGLVIRLGASRRQIEGLFQ